MLWQATLQLSWSDTPGGLEENFIIAQLHLDLADFCCSAGVYGKSTEALRSFYTIVDNLFFEVCPPALPCEFLKRARGR